MITIALLIFWISLIALIAFFLFKIFFETGEYRCCMRFRTRCDGAVLRGVAYMEHIFARIQAIPSFGYIARYITHIFAVFVAFIAHGIEARAHALADWASRREFERHGNGSRDTQSEFLKKVGEHKTH